MLQIKEISKKYVTGDLTQIALDKVSLNLRDNEFVAVLGPSGSGKTTLLNMIGGLDRYDSGDMIINGISTKKYKDRDWDSYRNHSIGFVFQSYNLIPHQSILQNVELALTISGIGPMERRKKAKEALEKVGLGDQAHKKPNQMSGGQMQRVAIARALVNDPDILLADEPTGALDSETSLQVMDLLKEVAKDRLVVMVTHNPDLANEYATRIVSLKDGRITGDSDPFTVDETTMEAPRHANMGKASMSFFTALSLSFNNLRTKMGRTILTSFAGSIGIIGIALILSLSNGVNTYINDIQKSTMTSYPIQIEATTFDLSSVIERGMEQNSRFASDEAPKHEKDAVYSDGTGLEIASSMATSLTTNNLTMFKAYLEDPNSEIQQYVGENGIVYSYDVKFDVFTYDPDGMFVNSNGSTLTTNGAGGAITRFSSFSGGSSQTFDELMAGQGGTLISPVITNDYDLLYGSWPTAYDEVIFIVNSRNEISATTLYQLGYLPTEEYRDLITKIQNGEEISLESERFSYEDIVNKEFYLLAACDQYIENEDGTFTSIKRNSEELEKILDQAIKLKVVGVARLSEDSDATFIYGPMGYTRALTDYIIAHTAESPVVKAQETSPDANILTGLTFAPEDDQVRIEDTINYLRSLGVTEKANMMREMLLYSAQMNGEEGVDYSQNYSYPTQESSAAYEETSEDPAAGEESANSSDEAEESETSSYPGFELPEGYELPDGESGDYSGMYPTGGGMDETSLAAMLDQFLDNDPDEEVLLAIYDNYISPGTYDDNMSGFGLVSLDAPSSISIYVDSFENKDAVSDCIRAYNKTVIEEDQITYTDYIGLLMSSVTTIINVISYVLIAFVAVSLVVSSIMIGIITYISVLERTKEIGILRAIGASKRNISEVFNAETFIIGLFAGILGIAITLLLLIPGNAAIHAATGSQNVNAILPVSGAIILIILSVILTLIGGFIPSRKAARKDPVTALRTE